MPTTTPSPSSTSPGPAASRVSGFIPTGWYPTAAQFTRDGRRILMLSGKGLTSQPNPRGPQPGITGEPSQYVGDAPATARCRCCGVPARDLRRGLHGDGLPPDALPRRQRCSTPARAPAESRRFRARRRERLRSATSSTSSGRTEPTIRSWATAAGQRRSEPVPLRRRRRRPTRTRWPASSSCSTTSTCNAEVSYDGHAFSTGRLRHGRRSRKSGP